LAYVSFTNLYLYVFIRSFEAKIEKLHYIMGQKLIESVKGSKVTIRIVMHNAI